MVEWWYGFDTTHNFNRILNSTPEAPSKSTKKFLRNPITGHLDFGVRLVRRSACTNAHLITGASFSAQSWKYQIGMWWVFPFPGDSFSLINSIHRSFHHVWPYGGWKKSCTSWYMVYPLIISLFAIFHSYLTVANWCRISAIHSMIWFVPNYQKNILNNWNCTLLWTPTRYASHLAL